MVAQLALALRFSAVPKAACSALPLFAPAEQQLAARLALGQQQAAAEQLAARLEPKPLPTAAEPKAAQLVLGQRFSAVTKAACSALPQLAPAEQQLAARRTLGQQAAEKR
jgi:hypothetical protein